MNKFLGNWLPVFLWAGIIFYFSSMQSPKASEFFTLDFLTKKAAHLTEYAILYTFIWRASNKKWATAFILTVAYAATDEFHQSFVPGRTPSPLDLGFDAIGASIASYVLWKLQQLRPSKHKK